MVDSHQGQSFQNGSSIQWAQERLSPGIKRPDNETDHSHPFRAEAKNDWSYNTAPLHTPSWQVLPSLTT